MWTEEECRNFEQGLKSYGKDFNLIQANKVTVVLNIIYVQCVCVCVLGPFNCTLTRVYSWPICASVQCFL